MALSLAFSLFFSRALALSLSLYFVGGSPHAPSAASHSGCFFRIRRRVCLETGPAGGVRRARSSVMAAHIMAFVTGFPSRSARHT
ncbi:hypothetical protein GGS20DRAFT_559601 [Poronia punctata]|nr:hypothetical protein GGS20DRAFT_559601 [Poronia punctata]